MFVPPRNRLPVSGVTAASACPGAPRRILSARLPFLSPITAPQWSRRSGSSRANCLFLHRSPVDAREGGLAGLLHTRPPSLPPLSHPDPSFRHIAPPLACMARQPRASKPTANAGIGLIRIASGSQLLLVCPLYVFSRAPGHAGKPRHGDGSLFIRLPPETPSSPPVPYVVSLDVGFLG